MLETADRPGPLVRRVLARRMQEGAVSTSDIWARIDVGIVRHPDCLEAGEDATNLHIRGILYCREYLTDGRIPKSALRTLSSKKTAVASAGSLVIAGLWIDHGDVWEVRDFLQRNPSKEEVKAKKDAALERKQRWKERNQNASGTRSSSVPEASTERPQNGQTQTQAQTQRIEPPYPPTADAAGGTLPQVVEIREAGKRGRAKAPKPPTPDATRVLVRMAELCGCRYESSPALEARLREGVPVEDCIAVVEYLARDPWWMDKRFGNAEAPFRRDKFASYLAQAKAKAPNPYRLIDPAEDDPYSDAALRRKYEGV